MLKYGHLGYFEYRPISRILAGTSTGETYYNRFYSSFGCFNKSSYGLIVRSHITPA